MEQGYIKIFRSIIDWEWYSDITTTRLYMHLLLKANYKEKIWKGETIGIGELITSLHNLSSETNLTKQQIRTSFEKLKKTGEITIQTTNKYSKIIINNYINYQKDSQTATRQSTHTLTHQATHQSTHEATHEATHGNIEIQAQNNKKTTNSNTLNNTPSNTLINTQSNIQTTRRATTTKEEKNNKNINNINNNINIIVEKWNEFCFHNNLSKVLKITEKRKKAIMRRTQDSNFDFDIILEKISQSDWLLGKSSNWCVTFDWIFENDGNFVKILEGNYQNKEKSHLNALESQMDKIKSVMDAI